MSVGGRATCIILSGGAEIVGLALAEALWRAAVPYRVVSLVPNSLLRGAPGCIGVDTVLGAKAQPDRFCSDLLEILCNSGATSSEKAVVFATEDCGLRFLNEYSEQVRMYSEFPRARRLRMGGLDKAELFECLLETPAAQYVPRTLIVDDFAAAEEALRVLGDNAVFKPALKPLDMDLSAMGSKVVTQESTQESRQSVLKRLRRAWSLSRRWVAQERLENFQVGERGVWAVRGNHGIDSIGFVEKWKYPIHGGSGCWVETQASADLDAAAEAIANALDYVGLCELPFLVDRDGLPRLLEMNARAWLQLGLAERSGFRVVEACLAAMLGSSLPGSSPRVYRTWINLERAMLAAIGGSRGPRLTAFRELASALKSGADVAVWSSPFPRVRTRWIWRMLRAALRQL